MLPRSTCRTPPLSNRGARQKPARPPPSPSRALAIALEQRLAAERAAKAAGLPPPGAEPAVALDPSDPAAQIAAGLRKHMKRALDLFREWDEHHRWLKAPSALSEDRGQSAALDHPRAWGSPVRPGARPQLLGSSPWPRQLAAADAPDGDAALATNRNMDGEISKKEFRQAMAVLQIETTPEGVI